MRRLDTVLLVGNNFSVNVSQAACLRAARLGGLPFDRAIEVDMRLAAIAFLYGRPSAAVKLYLRVMGQPSTTEDKW